MNKGLFLDLDGTLINSKYKVSEKNKKAIEKAKEMGWKIYLATGKSFAEAMRWAKELKLQSPIISSQGQIIIKPTFEIIKFVTQDFCYTKKILDSEIVKSLLRSWTIETVDAFWTTKIHDNELLKLLNHCEKEVLQYHPERNERDLLHSSIIGVYFDIPRMSDKELLKLMSDLNKKFPSRDFQYWYTEYETTTITIKPKHIDKWCAIKLLKKRDNLDFIASIGNGWSDKEMIKNSNIGIAMKNSRQKVKDAANWVSTYDNDEDGVAYEIYKILEQTKDI